MLSERARKVRPSGIRKMFERVASLRDPLDLSIGQPHFDVPPAIQKAAIEAIRAGHNRYTVTQGIPELNERVADTLGRRLGRHPGQTMITAGVSGGLVLSYLILLDAGDEVLLPDPHFVLYRVLADVLGVRPVFYDTYPDFRLRREALEAAVTERSRALLLNSPSNPTGVVYTAEELEMAADFARQHDLTIISDEIYDAFVYDAPIRSVAEFHEQTVVLGGFSKTYAMPGWRLGYAAGPAEIVDAMTTVQQFTFVCANTPAQHAAVVAHDVDMSEMIEEYRHKRDRICDALESQYQPVRPGGSFYVFPPVPHGGTGAQFAERALQRELLVVPGNAFSESDTHFRLSFAVTDEKLDRGIEALRALAGPAAATRP